MDLVAQAEVQGQLVVDPPTVLEESPKLVKTLVELPPEEIAAIGRVRGAEREVGQGRSGCGGAHLARELTVEIPGAAGRKRGVAVEMVLEITRPEPQGVGAFDD